MTALRVEPLPTPWSQPRVDAEPYREALNICLRRGETRQTLARRLKVSWQTLTSVLDPYCETINEGLADKLSVRLGLNPPSLEALPTEGLREVGVPDNRDGLPSVLALASLDRNGAKKHAEEEAAKANQHTVRARIYLRLAKALQDAGAEIGEQLPLTKQRWVMTGE